MHFLLSLFAFLLLLSCSSGGSPSAPATSAPPQAPPSLCGDGRFVCASGNAEFADSAGDESEHVILAGEREYFRTGAGNNKITLAGGTTSEVSAGAGADTIIIHDEREGHQSGDLILSRLYGGAHNDAFELLSGTLAFYDGHGADTHQLASAHIASAAAPANIAAGAYGGSGADSFTLNGGIVAGAITGEHDEADAIAIKRGTVASDINTRGGRDVITLTRGVLHGIVTGGADSDEIILTTASIGAANAHIVFASALTDCNAAQAGRQWICGGEGRDTLIYTRDSGTASLLPNWLFYHSGASGELPLMRAAGFESYCQLAEQQTHCAAGTRTDTPTYAAGNDDNVFRHAKGGGTQAHPVYHLNLARGNDKFTLDGGVMNGNVLGGEGQDVIMLLRGQMNGHVSGGSDNDTIAIASIDVGLAEANALRFAHADCASAAGQQWICGGEGEDTLKYLADAGADPEWLYDSNGRARFHGFSQYVRCTVIGAGEQCSASFSAPPCTAILICAPYAASAYAGTASADLVVLDFAAGTALNFTGGVETLGGKDTIILRAGQISAGSIKAGNDDDQVFVTAASLGETSADFIFTAAAQDCSASQKGRQWICGGEGSDTLGTRAGASWLFYDSGASSELPLMRAAGFELRCEIPAASETCAAGQPIQFTATSERDVYRHDAFDLGYAIVDLAGGADDMEIAGGAVLTLFGGEGEDRLTLSRTGQYSDKINAGGGNDIITLTAGTLASYYGGGSNDAAAPAGIVHAGTGSDHFILDGGTLNSITGADAEMDFVFLRSGIFTANTLDLGSSSDWLEIGQNFTIESYSGGTGTPAPGAYFGGGGGDSFVLNGGSVTGTITGGSDRPELFNITGTVGGLIDGGGGKDTINIFSVSTLAHNVLGGAGDDTIYIRANTIGESNADIIFTAAVPDCDDQQIGKQWICGGTHASKGDRLGYIAGMSGLFYDHDENPQTLPALRVGGFEFYFCPSRVRDYRCPSTSLLTFTASTDADTYVHNASALGYGIVNLSAGADRFEIIGGDTLTIYGGDNDDLIILNRGDVLYQDRINAGTAGDTIRLLSGTITVYLGLSESDSSPYPRERPEAGGIFGGLGTDTFSLEGGTVGRIDGTSLHDDVDVITIKSGRVGGSTHQQNGEITTHKGNDIITLSGGIIEGFVNGGADDDTVAITTLDVAQQSGLQQSGLVFSGSKDCDPALAGQQWICGGEGTDTLRYLASPERGGDPAWLFHDRVLRAAGFEVFIQCSGLSEGSLTGCFRVRAPANAPPGGCSARTICTLFPAASYGGDPSLADVVIMNFAPGTAQTFTGGIRTQGAADSITLRAGQISAGFVDAGSGGDFVFVPASVGESNADVIFTSSTTDCDGDASNGKQWICGGTGVDTIGTFLAPDWLFYDFDGQTSRALPALRVHGFDKHCIIAAGDTDCTGGERIKFTATDEDDVYTHSVENLGYDRVDLAGGNDRLKITGGQTLIVWGGAGNDEIILNRFGTGLNDRINAGADDDTIYLLSDSYLAYYGWIKTPGDPDTAVPSYSFVYGGSGNDTFILDGGTVRAIKGDPDPQSSDTIIIRSGKAGGIDTDDGNDVIILSGGIIEGYADGGKGDDTISITVNLISAAGQTGLVFSGSKDCDPDLAGRQWLCGGEGRDTLQYLASATGADPGWLFHSNMTRFAGFEVHQRCTGFAAGTWTGCTVLESTPPPICRNGISIICSNYRGGAYVGDDGVQNITLSAPNLTAEGLTSIDLKGGNDTLTIIAAPLDAIAINLGAGNDTLNLNDGTLASYNGGGDDAVLPAPGTAQGGSGADALVLNGGTITGNITGDDESDAITLNSGTVGGDIMTGKGADVVVINGGSPFTVFGGGDNDAFTLNRRAAHNDKINAGSGADVISVMSGTIASYDGGGDNITAPNAGTIRGGSGVDEFILDGGTVTGSITGSAETDIVRLLSGAHGGSIDLGGGNDTLELGAGFSGAYADRRRDAPNSMFYGGEGEDTLILSGATLTGTLKGSSDPDHFIINSGSVMGDVAGHGGNNTITLNGGTVSGLLLGGNENDIIHLHAGILQAVRSGAGEDVVVVHTLDVGPVSAQGDNPALAFSAGNCSGQTIALAYQWICGSGTLKYLAPSLSADPGWFFDEHGNARFSGFANYIRCAAIDAEGNAANDNCTSASHPAAAELGPLSALSEGLRTAGQEMLNFRTGGDAGVWGRSITMREQKTYDYEALIRQQGITGTLWQNELSSLTAGVSMHIVEGQIETGEEEFAITSYGAGFEAGWQFGAFAAEMQTIGLWFEAEAETAGLSGAHWIAAGRASYELAQFAGLSLLPQGEVDWQKVMVKNSGKNSGSETQMNTRLGLSLANQLGALYVFVRDSEGMQAGFALREKELVENLFFRAEAEWQRDVKSGESNAIRARAAFQYRF